MNSEEKRKKAIREITRNITKKIQNRKKFRVVSCVSWIISYSGQAFKQLLTKSAVFTVIYILILLAYSEPAVYGQKPIKNLRPTVILIGLDGFRYDYINKFQPKTLNQLAKKGVRAKWMTPSFPSKTFPNFYTIATGLYPEHHGIVENNIYDFGTEFTMSKREEVQNSRWWLGEPIWVTAEKQNQRAGCFFFPGTETDVKGVRPTFWKEYTGKIANRERIDTILGWLDLPKEKRPTLYTLYFSDTDDAGHDFSPDAEETKQAALKVDNDLAYLVAGLKKRKIFKKVNLIIVSDHGMATVNHQNAIFLDDLFDVNKAEKILWTGEIVQIFPKDGQLRGIVADLQKIQHARCWEKSQIPERFHYYEGSRIAPIVCSADEGWMMTDHKYYEGQKKKPDFDRPHGAHGYDNQLESMRATFIAHGPAFKKGYVAEPFENINVYNVMTKILGLTPAPNDGTFKVADRILK